MDPGITVIMLAKNEEAHLRRCLKSVRGHIQGLVALVDPLSTDGTAEVARENGGIVLSVDWPGAFDVARNLCLKHVKTEWVLWLDADEWFAGNDAKHLAELMRREDAFCFGLIRQEINERGLQSMCQVVRMFRSRPYVPFCGVVHEHLDRDSCAEPEALGKEYGTDLTFNHYGYTADATPAKLTRYAQLIEEELRLRPGQTFYEVKLACTLAAAKDPRAHAKLRELGDRLRGLSDELEEAPISVAEAMGPILAAIPEAEWRCARTDALLRLGRAWFPDNPAVLWSVAQFEVARGDLSAAFASLQDIEALVDGGRYDKRTPHFAMVTGIGLYTNLALVAHQLGRKDVARRNYERLLVADPGNGVARKNLALL
jgi:hypothetical protein